MNDVQALADSNAAADWTCSPGTWRIDVQQSGVSLPSPDVAVSPGVTGSGDSSCSRIDRVTVTITTGATPLPNFDPVTVTAHEALTVCGGTNCANLTNTGAQINLHQGLHIVDYEGPVKYIDSQTAVHLAGQLIDLGLVSPEQTYGSGCSWKMPTYYANDALSSYVQANNTKTASPVPSSPSPLATDEVTWYNDRGEAPSEISLQCEVLPHGSSTPITLEAAANLGFETPTPQLSVSYNPVFLSTNYLSSACQGFTPPETVITMGVQRPSTSPGPGISWQYTIVANDQSEQGGYIGLWQIVRNSHQDLITNGVHNTADSANCGDGNIPLHSGLSGMSGDVQNWNATWHDVDAPASAGLLTSMSYAELDDSFDDYLMYKPHDETYRFRSSIWISLGHFNWSFTANTTNSNGWSPLVTTYSTPGPSPVP